MEYIDLSKYKIREFSKSITYNGTKKISYLINTPGIYKLFDSERGLLYIGKSVDLGSRIMISCKEKMTSFFSFARTNIADLEIYEAYYIAKYKPKLNVSGKHDDVISVTLTPELSFSDVHYLSKHGELEWY